MKTDLSRSVSGLAVPLVALIGFALGDVGVFGATINGAPEANAAGLAAIDSLATPSGGARQPAQFPPSGFWLSLEEHFSEPQLNTDLWSTNLKVFGRWGDRYHNDSYLNYLSDEDVLVEGGALRLRAEQRSVEGDNPPGVYDYSAGMISSHDKFSFLYGYIEIRARFPGGPGVWPAFWLMPQSHQWPPEFDIAEYYAGRKLMHLGLCHGDFPEINWDSGGNDDVPFEQGWNTFGLLWMPGRAVWTQNGVVKRETSGAHVPNIPMYIILSNGVSSRIGPSGEPDVRTVFPNFFEVDTVRVWQADVQPQAGVR
jgi:beta-glucanase (GH16 family)